jgi:hypothetical protein
MKASDAIANLIQDTHFIYNDWSIKIHISTAKRRLAVNTTTKINTESFQVSLMSKNNGAEAARVSAEIPYQWDIL